MKCPACARTLKAVTCGDIEVDVCEGGCAGVWFDHNELLKFDEPHEFAVPEILNAMRDPRFVFEAKRVKNCPKCPGEVLGRQFFDIQNKVEVDVCWNCGGVWLDTGELKSIRSQFETTDDRAKAVNEYVNRVLAETDVVLEAETKRKNLELQQKYGNRLRAFATTLRELLGV